MPVIQPRALRALAALTLTGGLMAAPLAVGPSAMAADQTRVQVKAHIDSLRKSTWKAVTDSDSVPKSDYKVIRDRGVALLAQLTAQVKALSAAVGAAQVNAVGAKVDAIGRASATFSTNAGQVRSALADMTTAATRGNEVLTGALSTHTTDTGAYRAKQAAWAAAGTWAAKDRANALAAIAKGTAAPARTYPAQAQRATNGQSVTSASGLTGIPGGCALATASADAWLGAAKTAGLHAWVGPDMLASYNARVATAIATDPTGDLAHEHQRMLWGINTAHLVDAHPADANEAMSFVGKLGYQALADTDAVKAAAAKAALVRIAGELMATDPAVPGTFDGTFYMWAAASALNWAQPDSAHDSATSELMWVRWMGPYSCMLARGDSMVRGADNITVVTTSAIALTALADGSTRPAIAAALVKSAVSAGLPGMQLLAADGGTPEGPAYWNLQSVPVAGLLSTWKQAFPTGGPVTMPDMSKTADYAFQLPDTTSQLDPITPTYSDAKDQGKQLRSTLPAWVASYNPTEAAVTLAKQATTTNGIQMIWWPASDPGVGSQTNKVFATSGIAVLRSSTGTAWVTAGVPVDVHTHLQAGGVSWIRNGVQWGIDPGAGDYKQTGYFNVLPDGQRWRYFQPGVKAHSTLSTAITATDPGQVLGGLTPMQLSGSTITVAMKNALRSVTSATRTVTLGDDGRLTIDDVVTGSVAAFNNSCAICILLIGWL